MAPAANCQPTQLVEFASRFNSVSISAPGYASPGFVALRHLSRYTEGVLTV